MLFKQYLLHLQFTNNNNNNNSSSNNNVDISISSSKLPLLVIYKLLFGTYFTISSGLG